MGVRSPMNAAHSDDGGDDIDGARELTERVTCAWQQLGVVGRSSVVVAVAAIAVVATAAPAPGGDRASRSLVSGLLTLGRCGRRRHRAPDPEPTAPGGVRRGDRRCRRRRQRPLVARVCPRRCLLAGLPILGVLLHAWTSGSATSSSRVVLGAAGGLVHPLVGLGSVFVAALGSSAHGAAARRCAACRSVRGCGAGSSSAGSVATLTIGTRGSLTWLRQPTVVRERRTARARRRPTRGREPGAASRVRVQWLVARRGAHRARRRPRRVGADPCGRSCPGALRRAAGRGGRHDRGGDLVATDVAIDSHRDRPRPGRLRGSPRRQGRDDRPRAGHAADDRDVGGRTRAGRRRATPSAHRCCPGRTRPG